MKRTLNDAEREGKQWDTVKGKWVEADKDPVAVMAHLDFDRWTLRLDDTRPRRCPRADFVQ